MNVFQILQNEIILPKIYDLSIELIHLIFILSSIFSPHLLSRNLMLKLIVQFFSLGTLGNKLSYHVNKFIKNQQNIERAFDNGLYNQNLQINKKGRK
jgi:hypothetical protein